LYPGHTLRLLCADYTPTDVDALDTDLRALLSPKTSHMDFNIACALHFASRGEGYMVRDAYFLSD
jgi:asparagine synthetase B (glutamine-hydrolysing)